MGDDQSRPLQLLNDVGHRERLSGTGYAQKGLKLISFPKTFHKLCNGLRLVTGRCIRRMQTKLSHICPFLLCPQRTEPFVLSEAHRGL